MDDLISKLAVIQIIEKMRARIGHNLERSIGKSIIEILDEVGRDVDRLPSALGTNLAEVGTDCISRQAAIDAINNHFGFNIEEEYGSAVQEVINGLPSAQPDTGKATWAIHTYMPHNYYCTNCKQDSPYNKIWDFCPHCGAKMEGEDE